MILKLILTAIVVFAAIFAVGPALLTAPNDEAVLAGFALLTLHPLLIAFIWRREIREIHQQYKEHTPE